MGTFDSLLLAIDALFSYLGEKERRKYIDQYLELKELLREEFQKDDDEIDHSVIDNINAKLFDLTWAIRLDGNPEAQKPNSIYLKR